MTRSKIACADCGQRPETRHMNRYRFMDDMGVPHIEIWFCDDCATHALKELADIIEGNNNKEE